jgi:hypothetical protein
MLFLNNSNVLAFGKKKSVGLMVCFFGFKGINELDYTSAWDAMAVHCGGAVDLGLASWTSMGYCAVPGDERHAAVALGLGVGRVRADVDGGVLAGRASEGDVYASAVGSDV